MHSKRFTETVLYLIWKYNVLFNALIAGCFCIYNSLSSLEYLRESLEKTLMSDLEREDRLPFQGLPIAIVLAHDPGLSEKGLLALREDGQSLADR